MRTIQDMATQTQEPQTTRHTEHLDGSTCTTPELCGTVGTVFTFGGRAEHPDNLAE